MKPGLIDNVAGAARKSLRGAGSRLRRFLLRKWREWWLPPGTGARAESSTETAQLGRAGETAAARWLRRHGYRILFRNFRPPEGGEVDLVCRDKAARALVFVEVKTRAFQAEGVRASDAVDDAKQRLVVRGALHWLRLLDNPDVHGRFDVVEVYFDGPGGTPRIEHTPDAFPLPSPYIY